jgi:tRNA A37 threonylcarbamoyltransferase TsaD
MEDASNTQHRYCRWRTVFSAGLGSSACIHTYKEEATGLKRVEPAIARAALDRFNCPGLSGSFLRFLLFNEPLAFLLDSRFTPIHHYFLHL